MVVIKRCETYEFNILKEKLRESIDTLGSFKNLKPTDKVLIKPNLVGPFKPELGITTHPAVLKAVIQLVKEKTSNIVVGDNPAVKGLVYTLKKCKLYDIIIEENVGIINNKNLTTIRNSNPKIFSKFEVSKEMLDIDMVINLPKLKTHSLAYMTCAVKNFFGLIYGLNKSTWHVKASNPKMFGDAINDLYGAFLEQMGNKKILHICDGIIGLEGEGPSTAGHPIKSNVLISSEDGVSLDRVALEIAHLDYSRLFINQIGHKRGYGNGDLESIKLLGDPLDSFDIKYQAPKDSLTLVGLRLLRFKPLRNLLLEHPKINKKNCIKCGECVRICPPKALSIFPGQIPTLKPLQCIRCWCCAEVCPENAIEKTRRPVLGRIILKQDK